MAKFRISYNAPVVLTFALLAVVVRIAGDDLTLKWFATQGNLDGFRGYATVITHILGHANWDHLIGNFMLILLLGPILEERYGSLSLLAMILITATISGLVDVGLGDHTLGASGIVFMMILLASTANVRQGEIPLTFIAVAVIYLGGEIMKGVEKQVAKDVIDNTSHLSHILGGVAGAVFGFLGAKLKGAGKNPKPSVIKQMLPTATAPPTKAKP